MSAVNQPNPNGWAPQQREDLFPARHFWLAGLTGVLGSCPRQTAAKSRSSAIVNTNTLSFVKQHLLHWELCHSILVCFLISDLDDEVAILDQFLKLNPFSTGTLNLTLIVYTPTILFSLHFRVDFLLPCPKKTHRKRRKSLQQLRNG